MSIIVTLILGGVIGWLASLVTGNDARLGVIGNIVVGVIGAFLGGVLSRVITGSDQSTVSSFSLVGLFWAFLGAVVLLLLVNWLSGGTRPR